MNNYPPGAANDPTAPYNQKTKKITVDISVSLSTIKEIEVPEDMNDYDPVILEEYVREQIMLPQEILLEHGYGEWIVDEFCVL